MRRKCKLPSIPSCPSCGSQTEPSGTCKTWPTIRAPSSSGERLDGELAEPQTLFLKVRHKPFSVYVYYLAPEAKKGTEAIFVEGRNGGNILAHTTGIKDTLVGTLTLKPDSPRAMEGNRRPITEIGLLKLTQKTIDAAQRGLQYTDLDVRFIPAPSSTAGSAPAYRARTRRRAATIRFT